MEKLESEVKELKSAADDSHGTKNTNESLARKVQLLEEELETNDANLRETMEK